MPEKVAVTLCAVGDVIASHKDPDIAFEYVGPILREADITFAQNESNYTDRRDVAPVRGVITEVTSRKNAEALKLGGFDVMSFASNHCMDLGSDIMLETVEVLRKLGIAVVGVGRNLEEARRPVIIERKGTKVAFLAYASVLRTGYNAGPERPGCAPMRAWTLYHQADYQPGTPPQILTFPYKDDLEALIQDVKKAKAQADIVALSLHWGIHLLHATLATYQKEVAHAAIDAGTDIILGHHPHLLKGIEVYKGKPIFYSMGNFAFYSPLELRLERRKQSAEAAGLWDLYGRKLDLKSEWTLYMFPEECRKSMIVRCNIVENKIQRVSFLPVLINQKAQPQVAPAGDESFNELLQYVKEITESQGLETKYMVEGGEIVVSLA